MHDGRAENHNSATTRRRGETDANTNVDTRQRETDANTNVNTRWRGESDANANTDVDTRRRGETDATPRQRSRYVPAAERRAVYQRDAGRCTYVVTAAPLRSP